MIAPEYSLFIHSLATELDLQAGEEESAVLLHSVGQRMAQRMPLPACDTTESLELECNATLARTGWGHAVFALDQQRNLFSIRVHDSPRVGAVGNPPGYWFGALYSGLFTGWFAQLGETVTIRPSTEMHSEPCLILIVDPGNAA